MKTQSCFALMFVFALASCSGGGGGGGGDLELSKGYNEVFERVSSELPRLAAEAQFTFGSVIAAAGATVTAVDAEFNEDRSVVTIQRSNKPAISLDTANSVAEEDGQSFVKLSGRQSRTFTIIDSSIDHATASVVGFDWNSDDSADWIAGGYWLNLEVNPASLEFGVFVDGPELDANDRPTLKTSGTASYEGKASGVYASRYGTDNPSIPAGTVVAGDFSGIATLTANFGDGSIGGCVGCDGGILLSSIDGNGYRENYELRFGDALIDRSKGNFQGSNVSLFNSDIVISSSSGEWAGQFSNRLDDNDPRIVAGTFVGQGSTDGGSEGVFIGAFAAGKQ